jgi:hypothetical protein
MPPHADLKHAVITNSEAYKSDDSDGKIPWTWKTRIAVVCLTELYVIEHVHSGLARRNGSDFDSAKALRCPLFHWVRLSYVAADLGATVGVSWITDANTLAVASSAPFCGYLQDLLGCRHVCLVVGALSLVGIVVGTAYIYAQAVTGMCIEGIGAGIAEWAALAG